MPKVSIESIERVTKEALAFCDVSDESINIFLNTVYYANRSAINTHGIRRLPMFVEKIQEGNINPHDEIKTIIDSGAMAVLDACGGLGQVVSQRAIDLAIAKAEEFGIAAVGVRNSNNFGAAGYFGDYAARRGMAVFVFANAAPAIAPTGGNKTIFGTNPLCFAFPGTSKNEPIVLDMATTVAARSKIRLAAKNGTKIPMNWAISSDGKPTDDPNEALKGSLLPIAGYKGYGLSLFIDIFAGLLTGSAYAGGVEQLSNMKKQSNNGHLFIVIDTKRFMDEEELTDRIDHFCEEVRSCGEEGVVMLPGEPGYRKMSEHTDSVLISEKELEEVNGMMERLNLSSRIEEIKA